MTEELPEGVGPQLYLALYDSWTQALLRKELDPQGETARAQGAEEADMPTAGMQPR